MTDFVLAQLTVTAKVVITNPEAIVTAAKEHKERYGDEGWAIEELDDPAQAFHYLFSLEDGTDALPGGVHVLDTVTTGGPLQDEPDVSLLDRAQYAYEGDHSE